MLAAVRAIRLLFVTVLLYWPFAAAADVAIPPLTGRVVDQTGTLSTTDKAELTQKLKDLQTRKGSQAAVLIVPTTDPETIEQFSIRAAEAWKIGRRKIDDGALLVVAKNDHRLRIEVGYGLEGALTDVTARRIIDEVIVPRFRSGDFAGGISAGIDRIIRAIDGEPLPAPRPEASHAGSLNFDPLNPFLILPVILFAGIIRSIFGRLLGAAISGGLVTLIVGYLFGSWLAAALVGAIAAIFVVLAESMNSSMPGRGGVWSGGSSGGSWSSGSSDGGFSGGGGSFGGGGASGSW